MDLSEFYEPSDAIKCTIGRAIETLMPDEQAKVIAALAKSDITTSSIFRWFMKRDCAVAESSLRKHRTQACSCRV